MNIKKYKLKNILGITDSKVVKINYLKLARITNSKRKNHFCQIWVLAFVIPSSGDFSITISIAYNGSPFRAADLLHFFRLLSRLSLRSKYNSNELDIVYF